MYYEINYNFCVVSWNKNSYARSIKNYVTKKMRLGEANLLVGCVNELGNKVTILIKKFVHVFEVLQVISI